MAILDSNLATPHGGTAVGQTLDDREQQGGVGRAGPLPVTVFDFPHGATLRVAGTDYALSGQVTMDLSRHHYQTYIIPPDPTLYACTQQDWAAIYAARDVAEVLYHTARHDLRLPTPLPSGTGLPGLVAPYPALFARFDATGLLVGIRITAGHAKVLGATIAFAGAVLPIPGGVAGDYTFYVDAAGTLTLAAAPPPATAALIDISITNRPTNDFDRTCTGTATVPGQFFANGATVAVASGMTTAIPAADYRTGTTVADGVGGYITAADHATTVPYAANKLSALPLGNTPSWADPLCAIQAGADTGTNPIAVPYAQVIVLSGDYDVSTFTTPPHWQFMFVGTGPQYGYATAPAAYEGHWTNPGPPPYQDGARTAWRMCPGIVITRYRPAP